MDKKQLLKDLIQQIEAELPELIAAAQNTLDAATNEESKAENEYDTRGLEASYLAGAQAKRVAELEEDLFLLKQLVVRDFSDSTPIASTALVEVDLEGQKSWIFLLPRGGGRRLKSADGKTIQVLSLKSPLGEALVTSKVGDSVFVDSIKESKEYEILRVF